MIQNEFVKEIVEKTAINVLECYQCGKCSGGCPVASSMDIVPNQVIRMVQRGLRDEVLRSKAIWMCLSCETCTTRCPRDIDLAKLIDSLRELSLKERETVSAQKFFERAKTGVKDTLRINRKENLKLINRSFLETVRRFGRCYEAGLVGAFNTNSWLFFSKIKLGLPMFLKGKLKLLPQAMKNADEVKRIFERVEEIERVKL
ncbi:MAG: 4Fe-4S dicluster domain-containing protein [Candidatus Cloacimonadota bacterium]|nr:MAG: 4Fe-4S dicluster domain-containing protein [Candidatus Cloacimonadota bacterium]